MDFVELRIPAAGIWKRDCELISFKLLPELSIEFKKDSDQTKWKIWFDDYMAIKITAEEVAVHLSEGVHRGSFYSVKNSPWIAELSKADHPALKRSDHYVFFFYDEIIEAVATGLKYEQILS